MTDLAPTRTAAYEARIRRRYAAEKRFKAMGLGAILFSIAVLLFLLVTMTINGIGGDPRLGEGDRHLQLGALEAADAVDRHRHQ